MTLTYPYRSGVPQLQHLFLWPLREHPTLSHLSVDWIRLNKYEFMIHVLNHDTVMESKGNLTSCGRVVIETAFLVFCPAVCLSLCAVMLWSLHSIIYRCHCTPALILSAPVC